MADARPQLPTDRLVGILGIGRNGSSLLMRLLDGSAGLWIYPIELNVLSVVRASEAIPLVDWARAEQDEMRETYLSWLVESVEPAEDPTAVLVPATATPQLDLLAYLDAFRRAYGADRTDESTLLSFKTTEGGEADEYRHLFPGMRFLHILRDPYTAYASLKRTDILQKHKPFWFQGDLLRTFLERRWIPHTRFALEWVERDPARHRSVRYEDLIADPAAAVGAICAWLSVAPPSEPDVQTVLGGRTVTELPKNTSKDGVATPLRVVRDLSERHSYEDVVTDRERQFIAYRTAGLAERAGYAETDEQASRAKMLAEWVLPDEWERMNVHSRLAFGRAFVRRRAYLIGKLLTP